MGKRHHADTCPVAAQDFDFFRSQSVAVRQSDFPIQQPADTLCAVVLQGKAQRAGEGMRVKKKLELIRQILHFFGALDHDRDVLSRPVLEGDARVRCQTAEQVRVMERNLDALIRLVVPAADDINAAAHSVFKAKSTGDRLSVFPISTAPGLIQMADERVRRADAQHCPQANLNSSFSQPVGEDGRIHPCRGGSDHGLPDGGAKAHAFHCR